MAPTQQQNTESSSLYNNCSNSSVNTTSSLKSQSTSTTATSFINGSNSNRTYVENQLAEMESLLPISPRGLFHDDSFFEESRKHFHEAVKEVLDQWNLNLGHLEANLTSYRKLRESDLRDDNQAVSLTQDDTSHKVILDVKDFMDGDVKVKMMDENELKIEGNSEIKKNGTISHKSFSRSFVFPGLIKSDAVTSAMSTDGILTVTVPKTSTKNTQQTSQSSRTIHSKIKESDTVNSSSLTSENTSENSTKEEKKNRALGNKLDSLLPVNHRGLFFHDDFFESARKEYEKAVEDILGKSGINTSLSNSMSSYRTLRNTNLMDENQAVSVTEDHQCHKVVMDVRDFMHNDLQVKVVDENELVVEGTLEKKEGKSVSKKSFRRSFVFPGLVNSDAVSSALSSDGVLTITILKTSRQEPYVQTVRFSKEGRHNASETPGKVAGIGNSQNETSVRSHCSNNRSVSKSLQENSKEIQKTAASSVKMSTQSSSMRYTSTSTLNN